MTCEHVSTGKADLSWSSNIVRFVCSVAIAIGADTKTASSYSFATKPSVNSVYLKSLIIHSPWNVTPGLIEQSREQTVLVLCAVGMFSAQQHVPMKAERRANYNQEKTSGRTEHRTACMGNAFLYNTIAYNTFKTHKHTLISPQSVSLRRRGIVESIRIWCCLIYNLPGLRQGGGDFSLS